MLGKRFRNEDAMFERRRQRIPLGDELVEFRGGRRITKESARAALRQAILDVARRQHDSGRREDGSNAKTREVQHPPEYGSKQSQKLGDNVCVASQAHNLMGQHNHRPFHESKQPSTVPQNNVSDKNLY